MTAARNAFASSPFNFHPQVVAADRLRDPITITDVTLREGQQAAEIAFSLDDKTELAAALADAGVPVVQVGYAGADDEAVAAVRAACPSLRIAVLAVGWADDAQSAIAGARQAGADVCSVLFRSTDAHLANLGFDRRAALDRVESVVSVAAEAGFSDVAFAPSFSTLADLDFLLTLHRCALEAGATLISLADSTGTARPAAIGFIVEEMRKVAGEAGVRVHMHNDYGLAVANTLAALEAGADWVEATVNGLGERAGNCPLEELVLCLLGLYDRDVGVDPEKLGPLSALVDRLTGTSVPPMKPVVGTNCFANKLEIHVQAAQSDPTLMEPFNPALIGRRRSIVLGRGTGPTGVRLKAAELGVDVDDERIAELVSWVNRRAIDTKRSVGDAEFFAEASR
jgi:isopropylmalate/homocitrate/citramalate synthase